MNNTLRTTLATMLAAACLAGASVTFAADNGGHNNNGNGKNDHDSDVLPIDPNNTGSVACDNNAANQQAGCMKDGVDQQQQQQ